MNPKLSRLRELILKFSYEKRSVQLASGKMSDFYFDGKQTTLHPEGNFLVGELMFEMLREKFPEAEAIGGPTLGADPIVSSIASISFQKNHPLPAFIIRKEPKGHGTQNWLEGAKHFQKDMKIVLIEDVITTGGSLLKTLPILKNAQLQAVGVLVIVDREEGGRENLENAGLKVESLLKKSDIVDSSVV